MAGADTTAKTEAMSKIKQVAIGIALVGASGVILHFINPNFFR